MGSLSYGGMPGGMYISGSPYSTSVRDQPASGSIPAYSMWGSDSSQLYRPGSGGKDKKDKKPVCSTLLITTAALVVMAVLAIAAVAAYLGGKLLDCIVLFVYLCHVFPCLFQITKKLSVKCNQERQN